MDNETGELIRGLRRQQGLSVQQLADRQVRLSGDVTMSPERIRDWESGRRVPSAYRRGCLAGALGVPREMLDQAAEIGRAHV